MEFGKRSVLVLKTAGLGAVLVSLVACGGVAPVSPTSTVARAASPVTSASAGLAVTPVVAASGNVQATAVPTTVPAPTPSPRPTPATLTISVNGGTNAITYGSSPDSTHTATASGGTGSTVWSASGGGCTIDESSGVMLVEDATLLCTITASRNEGAATGSREVVLNMAKATILVTPYNVPYDGAGHNAIVRASGPSQDGTETLDLGLLVTRNSNHTDPGTYADSWAFNAGGAAHNFEPQSGTMTDTITPAASGGSTTP